MVNTKEVKQRERERREILPPSPDVGGPTVMMQDQMEHYKLKGARNIAMELPNACSHQMRKTSLLDQTLRGICKPTDGRSMRGKGMASIYAISGRERKHRDDSANYKWGNRGRLWAANPTYSR